MRAIVTGIDRQERTGKKGYAYIFIFFKDLDTGKSYRTMTSLDFRNFSNWSFILQDNYDRRTVLEGLIVKDKDIIDGDSHPRPARLSQTQLVTAPQRPISATQSSQAGLFRKTDETHHEGRDMYEKWRAESKRLKQEAHV